MLLAEGGLAKGFVQPVNSVSTDVF